MKQILSLLSLTLFTLNSLAQHEHHQKHKQAGLPIVERVEAQPLLAQANRIAEALSFIGSALPDEVKDSLEALQDLPYGTATIQKIQHLLDPFCLAMIDINPESRVKVQQGPAPAYLMQEGWTTYLLKVHNQANITAKLVPESPNAAPILHVSTYAPRMQEGNYISPGQLDNQFLEMAIYNGRPLKSHLSGLALEYVPIQFYTKTSGKREVKLGFNVGQGTQDIGFRNTIDILFDIKPAVKVVLNVIDQDGTPTMASFVVTDAIERFPADENTKIDYRVTKARSTHWKEGQGGKEIEWLPKEKKLIGIYPLPGRRIADKDTYPDFFFQPQVYRGDGEYLHLPPGDYHITYGRGPEYIEQYRQLTVPNGVDSIEVDFQLKRWIHMAAQNWFSADHHIHASGCSHYESPEEGVLPEHMWRQVVGEDLNMGNNLTWGPSWYYQKQFFTGDDHPLSNRDNILRYDVEVSGFPSSHAGHIVLLNLVEDDYPNTTDIWEWPSWTLPVLQWAKNQGGITGYAHSGWGLGPTESTIDIPNYVLPLMDGIGANEYIVTLTHDVVDFFSLGDTPAPAELNMWYHTLNCGFKIPISGETDFPCISDERVGRARIYAQLDNGLDFDKYMEALLAGRSYVSDGYAHLIDFEVNNLALGTQESTLKLSGKTDLKIKANAAAFLKEEQDEIGAAIASFYPYQSPYWHIERSRIDTTRKVAVELIVNGFPVAQKEIEANGNWNELQFDYKIEKSSWLALRVHPSAHTNPIYVEIDGKPIAEKASAEWCRATVDQCWKQKQANIRETERAAAQKAYDHARAVYDAIIKIGN